MRLLILLIVACRAFAAPNWLTDGTFNGWEGDTKATWRIEEGAFTAGSVDKNQPRNEFLCTKKEFGDFDLTLKWKLIGTEGFVNGGVQFRTKRIPNHHEVSGYQADLGAGYDGALYDESRRNKMLAQPAKEALEKAKKPLGEWNTYRIRAEGPRIQLWLNGVQTVDFTEPDAKIPRTGVIAVQIHGDAKSQVWYKEIIIKELGEKKPAAEPKGPTARFADPLPAPPREPFKDGKFEIRPGEVIVFTGGTNMVRLVEHGWFEASLALAAKEQKPRFRSMAWEGDTVYEQWRDQNFGSWKEQLDAVNGTCVFLWFGQMEALDESRDDAAFEQAAAKLLDEFKAVTPRLVVMTPMEFDNHPWPDPIKGLPDNTPKNERVLRLGSITKKLAAERGAVVLDWPALEKSFGWQDPWTRTVNGVHISDDGLRKGYAFMLTNALGFSTEWNIGRSALLQPIKARNRLWHDCWKTMNWAFAYSDRTEQPFGKGIGEHPPMARELEKYKPLLRAADERIHALTLGQTPPPEPEKPAQPKPQPQPPEVARATFKVRDGFEVNLFASEVDGLVKPLSMRWDERGRLWAACSPSYPQLVPGEPHGDYILVCEDTNADGKADKFHKFADGLTMPMGIEFAVDGGVYVCESTQLALFRDKNGDGVSDTREVILSGFGTGDTHQMINSLRWGPEGCLWFSQGLHIFSRIETPHGIVRFDRAGLWRFDPKTWKLQGFFGNAAAGANCWGVTFDDWGQVFHCAADNRPGFYTTPGLGTLPNPPPYSNIGALAVSPVKGMCMEYINSTHLPPDLQGALCKPVYFANQVLLYKLIEDGSGFKTEDLGPLLTSSSNAFRPLGVQTGPDGALYICDWYNPVIGHYQASYRDPNRDKIHGRIWRVSAKGREPSKRPALEEMDAAQLVEQLRSPERWVRDQARRLLAGKGGAPEEAWKAEDAKPEFLYEVLAVQATRGDLPEELLLKCLTHSDVRLRAFAVRVWLQHPPAPDEGRGALEDGEDFVSRFTAAVHDGQPRVRLEAVVGASYLKSAEGVELALGVLDHPRDRFIDYALANTIRATKPVWQPALEAGKMTFAGNVAHLAFLLQTDGQPDTAGALQKIIAGGKVPEESLEGLRVLLIASGNAEQLATAIKAGPLTGDIASALVEAARQRGLKPAGDFAKDFAAWEQDAGEESPDQHAVALCRLALAWGLPDRAARLPELTRSGLAHTAADAITALAEWKGREALPELEALTREERSVIAVAAAAEILRLDPAKGAAISAGKIAAGLSPLEAGALLEAALTVAEAPARLGEAFTQTAPPAAAALELLKTLATAGRSEPALAAVLRKAAGLPENASIVPDYSAEFVAKLIADAKASGDAARGKDVFMAAQSACIGCHKVGGDGGVTGPDLTAIGRGMTPELITESVLWPRRQIKEGFFLSTVTTHDGRVLSGYKVSEDAKSLTLRTPGVEATESVAKDKIKDRSDTGTLMPDGLTSWMTEAQRLDLLRYLFELGK